MPDLTLTLGFPSQELLDANLEKFVIFHNYQEQIKDPSPQELGAGEEHPMIDNPVSKEQFAKEKVAEWIGLCVRRQIQKEAKKAALEQADQAVDSTLSTISVS